MIALLVLFSIFFYVFVGGMVGAAVLTYRRKHRDICDKYFDAETKVLAGVFWPFVLPFIAGGLSAGFFIEREDRAQRKAARAEVAHRQRMAELQAEKEKTLVALEFLEKNGVHARVEEL